MLDFKEGRDDDGDTLRKISLCMISEKRLPKKIYILLFFPWGLGKLEQITNIIKKLRFMLDRSNKWLEPILSMRRKLCFSLESAEKKCSDACDFDFEED